MREEKNNRILRSISIFLLVSGILLIVSTGKISAQEDPPRPISVTTIQNLSFGSFYQGVAGGSVTINSAGVRSAGGSVVLLTFGVHSAAIFELVANPGTVVSFLKPSANLTDGSGHVLALQIDDTNPSTPFVTTNAYPIPTSIYVGGILTIGTALANPPGNYSGTFDITFIQE